MASKGIYIHPSESGLLASQKQPLRAGGAAEPGIDLASRECGCPRASQERLRIRFECAPAGQSHRGESCWAGLGGRKAGPALPAHAYRWFFDVVGLDWDTQFLKACHQRLHLEDGKRHALFVHGEADRRVHAAKSSEAQLEATANRTNRQEAGEEMEVRWRREAQSTLGKLHAQFQKRYLSRQN